MAQSGSHWVNVRKKAEFLCRLMEELAGSALISLEGDLSRCRFPEGLLVSREELRDLRRNTIWPRQDFVVLRLEPETVGPIFKQMMAAGLSRAILHVLIQRKDQIQLSACDNLDSESVGTGPEISEALLNQLKADKIICDYGILGCRSR